jgi:hypothetical protein
MEFLYRTKACDEISHFDIVSSLFQDDGKENGISLVYEEIDSYLLEIH